MEIVEWKFINIRPNQEQKRKMQLSGTYQELNRGPAIPVQRSMIGLVAQLVRALHQNRRTTGSIPARDLKVTFFASVPVYRSTKCI